MGLTYREFCKEEKMVRSTNSTLKNGRQRGPDTAVSLANRQVDM